MLHILNNLRHFRSNYCMKRTNPRTLYKYLLRQCKKLPDGPQKYYTFMIRQSFNQHLNETDPQRVQEIITRSYEDANWVLKKVSMERIPLVISTEITPVAHFWSAAFNYHCRPHLVNRKLAAATPLFVCKLVPGSAKLVDIFTRHALLYHIRKLTDWNIDINFVKAVTDGYNVTTAPTNLDELKRNCQGTFLSVNLLHPRKGQKCLEFTTFDKSNQIIRILAVQENTPKVAPEFPYLIELSREGHVRICVENFDDADTSSAEWLVEKLFPKILKWGDVDQGVKSLNLVDASQYCTLYNKLKEKYAPKLLQSWSEKAKTDPKKYVFEDLAIAAYLICLWTMHPCDSFVDCGCGNGLLVYVLNEEGYKGFGVDIRQRKTWEIYGDKADLRVETVLPTSTYPGASWLIGNHSDELTPWIPVIALNSSPQTSYFVLPCCPFDFNGKKYIRTNTKLSQYNDYINYIESVSKKAGFETSIDKLRIPSTKRTCLVGLSGENISRASVMEFVKTRMGSTWETRPVVEKPRNCTQLNRDLIERIIKIIVGVLLSVENFISAEHKWNQGESIKLADLSQHISNEDLKALKNECGGLKTLLKNHRYIFLVRGDSVSLRLPAKITETTKYREKPCWFMKHHPNGCLYTSEDCASKH